MWFEAYTIGDLPGLISVPLSALIAGDTSALRTPLYEPMACPTVTRLRAADLLPAYAGTTYVLPVASTPAGLTSTFVRPVSAITANGS